MNAVEHNGEPASLRKGKQPEILAVKKKVDRTVD